MALRASRMVTVVRPYEWKRFIQDVAVSPSMARLVFDFYDLVLASERLAPYFARVEMTRLLEHQAKFIASVMGDPPSFTDAKLRDAHAHLTISDAIFDEMIDLLEATGTVETLGVAS